MSENNNKPKSTGRVILLVIGIVIVILFTLTEVEKNNIGNSTSVLNNQTEVSLTSIPINNSNEDEITSETDDILNVLMVIHYVSLDGTETTDPNAIILDQLREAMDDKNKLQNLLIKTEKLIHSNNEVINTTGLVLDVSIKSLIKSYDTWINYLRGIDVNNINITEFQYQLAFFNSSNHDTYLKLIEHASMLPMVVVKFAEKDEEENTINENLKNHFLTKIDELFTDILKSDDEYHQKTNNRYAIAVLIRGYKDFFTKN